MNNSPQAKESKQEEAAAPLSLSKRRQYRFCIYRRQERYVKHTGGT